MLLVEFEKMVVEQDHEEALRINKLYDEKYRGVSSVALQQALEASEAELSEKFANMPGATTFGYSVAKNMQRWWIYGTKYGERVGYEGDRLIGRGSYYYRTFDLLEKERVWRSRSGQLPPNPFELEQDFAALILANTLEAVFEIQAAKKSAESLGFQSGLMTLEVEQPPRLSSNRSAYIISAYTEQQSLTEPAAVYIVEDMQDPRDRVMVMEARTGQPVVAASSSLMMAETIACGKKAIETMAFEHTQAILEARREA